MAHADVQRDPDQLIEQLKRQRSLRMTLVPILLILALLVGFFAVYLTYTTM